LLDEMVDNPVSLTVEPTTDKQTANA